MSYSVESRERVLAYRNAGHTLQGTRDTYKIAVSIIREWEDQLKRTGSLEADTPERAYKKIDPEKLKKYVKEHPDAFLKEMAEAYLQEIKEIPSEQMTYVSETGIDEYLYRRYARAVRGERVCGTVSEKKHQRIGLVAAKMVPRNAAILFAARVDYRNGQHLFPQKA